MKVIGAEIRFGHSGGYYGKREAKLVPLEIIVPFIGPPGNTQQTPEAEVTFHTTDGDVTMAVRLPGNPWDDGAPRVANPEEARKYLDRQIEAGV